jgi:hypothetical protein
MNLLPTFLFRYIPLFHLQFDSFHGRNLTLDWQLSFTVSQSQTCKQFSYAAASSDDQQFPVQLSIWSALTFRGCSVYVCGIFEPVQYGTVPVMFTWNRDVGDKYLRYLLWYLRYAGRYLSFGKRDRLILLRTHWGRCLCDKPYGGTYSTYPQRYVLLEWVGGFFQVRPAIKRASFLTGFWIGPAVGDAEAVTE